MVGVNAERVVEARLYDWSESKMDFVETAAFDGE